MRNDKTKFILIKLFIGISLLLTSCSDNAINSMPKDEIEYVHSDIQSDVLFANKNSIAVRCSGITKKRERCKRMTKNSDGRCFQH